MVQPVLPDMEPKLINSCCTEPPWTCGPGMGSIGRLSTEASILPEVSAPSSTVIISSSSAVWKLIPCKACIILGFEKVSYSIIIAPCKNLDLVWEWYHIWSVKCSCWSKVVCVAVTWIFCRRQFGSSSSGAEPQLIKLNRYSCGLSLLFGFIYSLLAWKQNTGFLFRINCGLCSRTGFSSAFSYKLERRKLQEKIQPKWNLRLVFGYLS